MFDLTSSSFGKIAHSISINDKFCQSKGFPKIDVSYCGGGLRKTRLKRDIYISWFQCCDFMLQQQNKIYGLKTYFMETY